MTVIHNDCNPLSYYFSLCSTRLSAANKLYYAVYSKVLQGAGLLSYIGIA